MKKLLSILILLGFTVSAQEQDPCYSVKDFMTQTEVENSSITKNFVGGWNMFGYPCSQEIDVVDAFSSIIDKVLIVKSNNGSVYMPEFGFNGIGFLEGGEGYQIKMSNTEYGFSFCEPIIWPNLEGCTDCEAVNFNQWANVDDGSCNYDSDGDGIPDSEEVVGCQDSTACDYDIIATDSGECSYAQDGYDCDGNLLIYVGAEAHGGIVFYYDSIGGFGLVASISEIDAGYLWGCYGETINGADGVEIGTGYQNTLDITNECSELPIAASECLDYESNGFSDWFLPSKDELLEMHNTVGEELYNNGAIQNNWYWSSSEYNNNDSWYISLPDGNVGTIYKGDSDKIIPIRAFGNWTMGCMDEAACNYNSEANMADGSCEYPQLGYNCDGNINVQVGDQFEGGVVFYLNEDGQSGLISSTSDLGLYQWGCVNIDIPNAESQEVGFGCNNTLNIINNCGDVSAAQICSDYTIEDYNDWFLPSFSELSYMYSYKNEIGGFEDVWYWSSSELSNGEARMIHFLNHTSHYTGKDNSGIMVRPIRAFGNWVEGCLDESACNYSYNSTINFANQNLCDYPEEGFDCNGSIIAEIGDVIQGGYLYYINESLSGGLVASQDINSISSWSGAISSCQSHSSNGYNDWFLPSLEQQQMICEVIGYESDEFVEGMWTLEGGRFYWSSTQGPSDGTAYFVYTNNCSSGYEINSGDNINASLKYRPVRTIGNIIYGCTDSIACNYNTNADFDDGSCNYSIPPYDCNGNFNLQIGDELYGGRIFYLDETGEHGLVVGDEFEGSYYYGCSSLFIDGAMGSELGSGNQNTIDIISECSENPIAASISYELELLGYDDWYLPSIDELWMIWNNLGQGSENGNIGGFSDYNYWSSTQVNAADAKSINFGFGTSSSGTNKGSTNKVVPIRSF